MRASLVALAMAVAACEREPTGTPPCSDCSGTPATCDDRSVRVGEACTRVGLAECGPPFAGDRERCEVATTPSCARGTLALPGESACASLPAAPTREGSLFVDATAEAGGDGSAARPLRSIQEAVTAAALGATIVIRGGSYRENVRVTQNVVLAGEGATKVEIAAPDTSRPALELRSDATVSGLAVTGGGVGVAVTAGSVSLSTLWVHDTGIVGINASAGSSATTVRIERVLVESCGYAGVAAFGADVEIISSAIRDTRLHEGKGGPGALAAFQNGKRPRLTVRRSLVERNREVGVGISGGDLVVEDSVVRDTEAAAGGTVGIGVLASIDRRTSTKPTLVVRRTLVTGNREIGIAINSGTGVIENTMVDDTRVRAVDQSYGVGVQADPGVTLDIRDSVVGRSRHMGIAFFGATGSIERTLVRDTLPEGKNKTAVGIAIVDAEDTRPNVTLTLTLAIRNRAAGLLVAAGDVKLDRCSLRDTAATDDGRLGDGLVAIATDEAHASSVVIDGLTAERNVRAGIALFGASMRIRGARLTCNGFDLNAEDYPVPATLKDDGDNICGCDDVVACKAASNALAVQPAPARAGR